MCQSCERMNLLLSGSLNLIDSLSAKALNSQSTTTSAAAGVNLRPGVSWKMILCVNVCLSVADTGCRLRRICLTSCFIVFKCLNAATTLIKLLRFCPPKRNFELPSSKSLRPRSVPQLAARSRQISKRDTNQARRHGSII